MAMTLRLPDDVQERLRATAEREHRSMQQVAVDAIDTYTSDRNRRRDDAIQRIVTRDHAILDKLA